MTTTRSTRIREGFMIMICQPLSLKLNVVGEEFDLWVDISATRHVCKNRDMVTSYELVGDGMNMLMRNSSSSKVIRKDIAELRFISEKTVTLRKVLHVLYIRKNLVFRSLLSKHRFKMVFEFDEFILTKHDESMIYL